MRRKRGQGLQEDPHSGTPEKEVCPEAGGRRCQEQRSGCFGTEGVIRATESRARGNLSSHGELELLGSRFHR